MTTYFDDMTTILDLDALKTPI